MMIQRPESINGFKKPTEYEISDFLTYVLNLGSFVVLAEFFFPGSVAALVSTLPFGAAEVTGFLYESQFEVIAFGLFTLLLVLFHELNHAVAHKLNGFDWSYGIAWSKLWKIPEPMPYIVVLDDPLTRSENIIGLLTPLVVLTLIGLIGLLPIFSPTVGYYAKILLVVNTAGSTRDIYNSIKVGRYPPGTLFLNINIDGEIRTFTYEPED